MRSRYSAFAVGDAGYLLRTWHPSARPRTLSLDPALRWTGGSRAQDPDGRAIGPVLVITAETLLVRSRRLTRWPET
jgi:SEC-C motif-containing protein